VEAPAQGDEGESPGEIENPGEHRAPNGINPRLGATYSRGEKGPEDEPISQRTACLRSERAPDLGLAHGRAENTRSVSVSPASAGGPYKEHVTSVEQGIRSVTTASCRPPHPAVDRGTSHDWMSLTRTGFGRPRAGAADTGCCRWLMRAPPGDLGHQEVRRSAPGGLGWQEYSNDEAEGGTGCGGLSRSAWFSRAALSRDRRWPAS
jgi:hypothetical protein